MAYDFFIVRHAFASLMALALVAFSGNAYVAAEMQITDVSVGFDGKYKTGAWTPVRITVSGAPTAKGSKLVLTASDDEGVPCQFANNRSEVMRLATSDKRAFEGYVCFGRRPATLKIELTVGDETVHDQWQPTGEDFIASTQQWVLVFGAKPLEDVRQRSIARAARLLDRPLTQEVRVLQFADASKLPEAWFGYDAFDMVVVFASDMESWRQVHVDQWESLDQWTKLGGQILMCAGEHSAEVLRSDSPVTQFLPGTFAERLVVANTSKLESFAVATERLDVILQKPEWSETWRTPTGQGGLPMALIRDVKGQVLAAEEFGGASIPLAIRGVHGLGQTMFVPMDLDAAPLRSWSGYNKLLIKLLRLTVDRRSGEQAEVSGGRVAHLGFGDISGQLRTALEQFPGVRLIPFALIGVFAAAYVLLIGPLEYLGLGKLKDKMHWTWVTFPLTALAVCGLAILMANRWKGTEPKANQVDLVDWDADARVLRGQNWTHFFSPKSTTFDCRLERGEVMSHLADNVGSLLSWDGLPGQSFGGMDAASPLQPQIAPYTINLGAVGTESDWADVDTSVEAVSLPIASSRAIRGEWWNFNAPDVVSDLQGQADTYVTGKIRNPFDTDLRDAALLYERWYFKLGRIPANSTVTIDRSNTPTSAKSELIGRIVLDDGHVVAPWQQSSANVARIMQMVMFQASAGGRGYTGLVHRHDGKLDFTPQLAAGRAVLMGRIRSRATQLNTSEFTEEATQHWTYCRLVLPVTPFKSAMAGTNTVSTTENSP